MKTKMITLRMLTLCAVFGMAMMGFAQSYVTMTTSKAVGAELVLTIGAKDGVQLDGLEGEVANYAVSKLKVTKQTFTITGTIESVVVNDCGITSVDLTHAPELLTFKAEQNKLTELDLRENKALTTLYCSLNALKNIDVSQLAKLRFFSCHTNSLKRLDVANNPNLKELYCYDNHLTELDVTKCLGLKKLSCGGNQLTTLDVSNNKMLGVLLCHNNKLEDLNVANNRFLYQLAFSNNNISTIDLSNNLDLEVIYADNNPLEEPLNVENMKQLEQLFVFNTNTASMDLSTNVKLQEFSCSHNMFSELDFSHNPALRHVWVQDNRIGAEGMKKLVASLPLRSATNKGILIMKDVNVDDMNECLKEDVVAAQEKFWTLYEIEDEIITPYEGMVTGLDMTCVRKMSVVRENGILRIDSAKPNAVYEVFRMDGVKIFEGVTDAMGGARCVLNVPATESVIVKCGMGKVIGLPRVA
ncbi:MAG: leucine-rich repeat domain-containing protein [Prevotella sp.]|nr:hypothetical protein [Prevotella sp.]MDY4218490.1 leucine-rich repeat domain-containing protein [Prevotella sp.]